MKINKIYSFLKKCNKTIFFWIVIIIVLEIIYVNILEYRMIDLNNKWISSLNEWQNEKALKYFNEALSIYPENIVALNNKWLTYMKLNDFDKAIEFFDKTLKLDPKDHKSSFNKWVAFFRLWKYEQAIKSYDKALSYDSKNDIYLYHKWFAFYNLWQLEESITYYNKVLKISPTNYSALNSKWWALEELWKIEDAYENYMQAIIINPELCYDWVETEKFDKIFKIMEWIKNNKNETILVCKWLTMIWLWYANQANDLFRKALKINPNNKIAKDALR